MIEGITQGCPKIEGIIQGYSEIAVLETIGNSLEHIYDVVSSQ